MRRAVLILAAWAGLANANPVLTGQAFISYEHLAVEISPSEAQFKGTFLFSFIGGDNPRHPLLNAYMEVPVWVPLEADSNPLVAQFWSVFRMSGRNLITFEKMGLFDKVVGICVVVENQPHRAIYEFSASSGKGENNELEPTLEPEPGFCCLWFPKDLRGDAMRSRTPVTISYRTPLLETNGETHFFYTPVFQHIPPGFSTADTRYYSITLTAAPNCRVTGKNGDQKFKLAPGKSIVLTPVHLRPIRAVVEALANPQAAANGRQPFGSETNRTSAAAASRRSP